MCGTQFIKDGVVVLCSDNCSPYPGSVDGSLSSLTYVDETAFKRLYLLQGQLVRTVQHVAALNPKAFRCVLNPPRICKRSGLMLSVDI